MKNIILLFLCTALLFACSDDKRYAPKEGRLSVFEQDAFHETKAALKLDSQISTEKNKNWVHANYNAQNKLPHLQVNLSTKSLWKERIGKHVIENKEFPTPLVFDQNVYTLNERYQLTKLDLKTGKILWQKDIADNKQGLAIVIDNKKIFAVSTDGLITALDLDGKQLWQKDLAMPMRSAPIAGGKSIYLITATNHFIVLNQKDGKEAWRYQTTKPETYLTKMASPSIAEGVIVVPFSTGEVMAFDADSGLILWIQMMIGNRPKDMSEVPQVVASPVIERGYVYLSGNANLTGAYNLKTGEALWTNAFGSKYTPIVSGNALFILTNDNTLIALNRQSGKAFWQQSFTPEKNQMWQGMLLLNNQIALYSNTLLQLIDVKTGKIQSTYEMDIYAQPIVVSGHLITLNEKTNVLYHE